MKTQQKVRSKRTATKKSATAKKRERAEALKKVKELREEFGFTAGVLKGAFAEGRKKI